MRKTIFLLACALLLGCPRTKSPASQHTTSTAPTTITTAPTTTTAAATTITTANATSSTKSAPASLSGYFTGAGLGMAESLLLRLNSDGTFEWIHLIHFELPPVELDKTKGKVTFSKDGGCLAPAPNDIEACFQILDADTIQVTQVKDKHGAVKLERH